MVRPARQHGLSLIETMVSLLLATFLLLAAVSVFLSSRKVMETSDGLTTVLESSRTAFQLMGRDIREAGGNPCSSSIIYSSTLNNADAPWWSQVSAGLQGYAGTTASPGTPFGVSEGQRVRDTHAFDLHTTLSPETPEARVVSAMSSPSSRLDVLGGEGFSVGDIALVCDPLVGHLFQVTGVGSSGTRIFHAEGGAAPGNCTSEFAPDSDRCSSAGAGYLFEPNAAVVGLSSARWYVGHNGRGTTSLFRASLSNPTGAGSPTSVVETEVAEGVVGMQVDYQLAGQPGYVPVASVTDWRQVAALRITLDLQVRPGAQTEEETVRRTITHVATLRNRFQ